MSKDLFITVFPSDVGYGDPTLVYYNYILRIITFNSNQCIRTRTSFPDVTTERIRVDRERPWTKIGVETEPIRDSEPHLMIG